MVPPRPSNKRKLLQLPYPENLLMTLLEGIVDSIEVTPDRQSNLRKRQKSSFQSISTVKEQRSVRMELRLLSIQKMVPGVMRFILRRMSAIPTVVVCTVCGKLETEGYNCLIYIQSVFSGIER